MATTYEVTCATKVHAHRHIIGIGSNLRRWTVQQARDAIDSGDVFYTSAGSKVALVGKWTCSCGVESLRTESDSTTVNNLDNLPNCP